MADDGARPWRRAAKDISDGFDDYGDAIRARSGMFIGGRGPEGLHFLISHCLENSIAEVLAGTATHLAVTVHADGAVTVADNGAGIDCAPVAPTGQPRVELLFTLYACAYTPGRARRPSAGIRPTTCSASLFVFAALCPLLEVEVQRHGRRLRQTFASGRATSPLTDVGPTATSGTAIRFLPDEERVGREVNYTLLEDRLRELAYLHPGLTCVVRDERAGNEQEHRLCAPDGLAAFVTMLTSHAYGWPGPKLALSAAIPGGSLQVAMGWIASDTPYVRAYANDWFCLTGGTHVLGMVAALRRSLSQYGRAHGAALPRTLPRAAAMRGLVAVIAVRIDAPTFGDNIRGRLDNEGLVVGVRDVLTPVLDAFWAAHPDLAQEILAASTTPTQRSTGWTWHSFVPSRLYGWH